MLGLETDGPIVKTDGVTFRLKDPGPEVLGVSLYQEVMWPREGPQLNAAEGGYQVAIPRPPVDRMEYLFQYRHRDGHWELGPDPGNRKRAPGPFGEKSVIEFPEYQAPTWTTVAPYPRGDTLDFDIPCPILQGSTRCRLWSAPGTSRRQPLPLLIALDGLEYDAYSALTQFLDHQLVSKALPPMRAALLHPVQRDRDYSASPDFVRSLRDEVLPHLQEMVAIRPEPSARVGMGASLGGLAVLHAQWSAPELLGGLLLQSASVFNHHYFSQRLSFEHMERICQFTDLDHSAFRAGSPASVVLTCGTVEETLLANTAMAASLRRLGYRSQLDQLRDAHNWIAWRDAFAPSLGRLLNSLWQAL
jgi:enterochelin esterase family protein